MRLQGPLGREIDVGPAGEAVLEVPDALPVPEEDQLDHARSLGFDALEIKIARADYTSLPLPAVLVRGAVTAPLGCARLPERSERQVDDLIGPILVPAGCDDEQ